jgi:isochorismate synthase
VLADPSQDSELVREAARRARSLGRPVLASWTQPWSAQDAVGFFGHANAEDRTLWLRPASGEALVGIGAAHVLTANGTDRFQRIAAAWRCLLADAVVDDTDGTGPLLMGGFSFDPVRTPSRLWDNFPHGMFVVPERTLVLRDGATWLTTNVMVKTTDDLEASVLRDRTRVPKPRNLQRTLSPEAWQTRVGLLVRGMRSGQLGVDKVVLARQEQLSQARPIDVQAALRILADSYPSCTVFAINHGDASFLGATPERLITLRNGTASTMALAGSVARGVTEAEDDLLARQLMRDPKERSEHAIVVGALRAGLASDGLCSGVVADAQPRVHKLPNLQHLMTPIRGQVARGRCVLDLVEQLHPTPAVGGFPTQRALEIIRAWEHLDRGWYAGPLGWVNRHGEGEFVVGIRSALVRGSEATLFAGCGIVADSDPAAEYAESGWKLRPMLAALGGAA